MVGLVIAVLFGALSFAFVAVVARKKYSGLARFMSGCMLVFTVPMMLAGVATIFPETHSERPGPRSDPAEERFNAMTSAQHFAEAQKLIQDDTLHAQARKHLNAISADSPEKEKVSALAKTLDSKEAAFKKRREEERRQQQIDENPLEVVKSSWVKTGFGTVSEWRVVFKNRSKRPVGNIKYRTTYYSETGSVVDSGGVDSVLTASQRTIQRVIRPGETRTVEVNDGFVHNEAHRARFELVGWEFVSDMR